MSISRNYRHAPPSLRYQDTVGSPVFPLPTSLPDITPSPP